MIRLLFDRPDAHLKIYDENGALWNMFATAGDAWGNHGVSDDATPPSPPYGHACWTPPGHYMLSAVQIFDAPINSEGYGQIPLQDLDDATLRTLVTDQKAADAGNGLYSIGGIALPVKQIAALSRIALMIHCGGSNAPDPLADHQELCCTFGCTRMYNVDWRALAAWLAPKYNANVVIYSVYGDPRTLAA